MLDDNFKIILYKDKLIKNYKYLERLQNKKIISVVKANAYGHGLENVVKVLSEIGCEYFAVTREYEAKKIINLKLKNIKILIMDSLSEKNFIIDNKNIEIFINSLKELEEYLAFGVSTQQMHLKLDYGFGRNGILQEELIELKEKIEKENLKFKGIATHIFASEYKDIIEIEENFYKDIKFLGKENFEMIHFQNSAGVMSTKGEECTHIRCGTILFGLQEIGYYDPNIERVFKLEGGVSSIKLSDNIKYIGYEKKKDLHLKKGAKIGKIKLGYGDGFSKRSEGIMSIINNKKFRILHISMDSSFIEIDESVKIGDKVELFYDLEETMKYLKVPHYEFISMINDRIERVVL